MRPVFSIDSLSGSWTLEGRLQDRTTRLRTTDAEGVESDTLELEADDRAGRLPLPSQGEQLRLWIGYAAETLVHLGDYVVDEVGLSAPPMLMQVSGKGMDLVNIDIKAPRPRSREADDAATVGDLARVIAGEHGLAAQIHPEVDAIPLGHIDQWGESNVALLQRLARQHDLTLRLSAALLVLRPHAARLSLGDPMLGPHIQVRGTDISRYRWRRKAREDYDGARAHWYDQEQGERIEELVGGGERVYDVRHDARDAEEAERTAAARLHQLARETEELNLQLPGNPRLRAGARLLVVGIQDPVAGYWSVRRATHQLDKSGYVTTVDLVPPAVRLVAEGRLPASLGVV